MNILLFLSINFFIHSYEIDNFHNRNKNIKDSTTIMNQWMNSKLDKALEAANQSNNNKCDPEELRSAISASIGGNVVGTAEKYAIESDKVDKISPPYMSESIYGDTDTNSPWSVAWWAEVWHQTIRSTAVRARKIKKQVEKKLSEWIFFMNPPDPVEECNIPEDLAEFSRNMVEQSKLAIEQYKKSLNHKLDYNDNEGSGFMNTSVRIGSYELTKEQMAKQQESIDNMNKIMPYMLCLHKFMPRLSPFNRNRSAVTGLEPVVNINNHKIGADKFGHFIDQGFEYYELKKKDSSDVESILKFGESLEEGIFGLGSTKIKSYGDLAANYDGFLFWHSITDGTNPYFICVRGKYKKNKNFDWRDYITSAWDEGINCSEYSSKEMDKAVMQNIKNRGFTCPADSGECNKLANEYPNYVIKSIIGPKCAKYIQNANSTKINKGKRGVR